MTNARATPKNAIRIVVIAIVVWGIARAFDKARVEFSENELRWQEMRWLWLFVSGATYGAGLSCMGYFWFVALRTMKQPVRFSDAMRAYFIGHLGKYVPGKAMVLVLRTGLIRGPNIDTVIAGVAVFIETLTMMAVGASLAAVVLGIQYRESKVLLWSALGTAVITILPTLPPVFAIAVRRLRPQLRDRLSEITDNYSFRLVAVGWATNVIGWSLLAISLWAAVKAFPIANQLDRLLPVFPLFLASVSLAVVLGFASLIPGGLLVREWIMSELLAPRIGHLVALGGTIVVRLVWLVTELLVSAMLYLAVSLPPDRFSAESDEKVDLGKTNHRPPTT